VEPTLIQPTFVTDYPSSCRRSPSARRPTALVERFEPFLAGMEIGNAFSELNDPDDQRERLLASRRAFEPETRRRIRSTRTTCARSRWGCRRPAARMGVDRLAMILCDAPNCAK